MATQQSLSQPTGLRRLFSIVFVNLNFLILIRGYLQISLYLVQTEYDALVNSSQVADFLGSAQELPHASVKQVGGGK